MPLRFVIFNGEAISKSCLVTARKTFFRTLTEYESPRSGDDRH